MKLAFRILALMAVAALVVAGTAYSTAQQDQKAPPANQYSSVNYANANWQKMMPELGADSPEITILRVDPKTQATHLLIRNPRKMHIPMH
ncbi:MAG: hypothetical protein ACRD2A_10485, partial [Vicinamibacterales bacterium]